MKKKKISLKNLIYDNRFVLTLSIIAAVIIWIVVAIQASPEDDRIVKDVPVKIEISNNVSNLGLQMFGNTDFTVEVKVHGKRYDVAESVLTKDDISVVAKRTMLTPLAARRSSSRLRRRIRIKQTTR